MFAEPLCHSLVDSPDQRRRSRRSRLGHLLGAAARRNPRQRVNLETLYGTGPDAVEKVDLLAGTHCETDRPEHFGFGETMFQVFLQMASRRLESDPFFTEKFTEEYYTKEGMDLIDQATLKSI